MINAIVAALVVISVLGLLVDRAIRRLVAGPNEVVVELADDKPTPGQTWAALAAEDAAEVTTQLFPPAVVYTPARVGVCGVRGPVGMRCDRLPHDPTARHEEGGYGWYGGRP